MKDNIIDLYEQIEKHEAKIRELYAEIKHILKQQGVLKENE